MSSPESDFWQALDLLQNSKRDTVMGGLDLGFSAVLLAQSTTMT